MVDWYDGEISTLVTLHSYGGTNQQSTEKQICTKLHVQVEQAKCCFNMFSQNQNKAERLNPSEKRLCDPFLWMRFNCLKATEALRGDSLLFTIPGTQLIDLERMKGSVELGAIL